MLTLRKAAARGAADHGWLQSRHSFSFADYHDPQNMHFGALRVLNEDRVAPGMGFGAHSHRDMEIISYVLSGQLQHRDSMGNSSIIRSGAVQRMSAGTGVTHSEFNPSAGQAVHFLQIWIVPATTGLPPSYEEAVFDEVEKHGQLRLAASPDGTAGSVRVHQDVSMYCGVFDTGDTAHHPLAPGRRGYLHLARGTIEVNGMTLHAGDALMLENEGGVTLRAGRDAEVLLFDLA
ncbi:pirin family protein [Chitiniphilus purpureus]|uniref:Pirin family protein n=1 Tax=Chitiniphilus purpureus TaxID=2981137 RepID=A0ABY6DRA6_9NEIS|nr:pirin family protein [Chitiniphilus sp. CD1]UXY16891.1 pirin family protein [Chitiniphilus sp. CD1]